MEINFDINEIKNMGPTNDGYRNLDGFIFTSINKANIYDAIVIRNPFDSFCFSPIYGQGSRTVDDCIELINQHQLEKAIIIGQDISFINQCPSLKYLTIYPSSDCVDGFDYSPLYNMSEITYLSCRTEYDVKEDYSTIIDYSCISGIRELFISGKGHLNYQKIKTLEKLYICEDKYIEDLSDFECPKLKELTLLQCGIKSLKGIENLKFLQRLDLWYDRKLENVSEVAVLKDVLRWISIKCCPKIADFSSFYDLIKMEALSLKGKNDLPSLDFVKNMPNLTWLILTMNVLDGDMTPCLKLPYVDIKAKKHYNLRNRDLPKNSPKGGFVIK